jgi:hypothetical protein
VSCLVIYIASNFTNFQNKELYVSTLKLPNFDDETAVFLLARGIFQRNPSAFLESLWGLYKETYKTPLQYSMNVYFIWCAEGFQK